MAVGDRKKQSFIAAFFQMEASGGLMLLFATLLALVFANTVLSSAYDAFLHSHISVTIAGVGIDKPVHYWINDGLMAIFFLLVGLEIKREILEGELATVQQAMLPVVAACGGVALPAMIYSYFNWSDAAAMHGWAIPAATDIAFALGILALFGKRVPIALKVFLTAVAVIDDLMAIVIIAVFYNSDLSVSALGTAFACGALLLVLNRMGVRRTSVFVLIGVCMWVAVLKSGVHATLAGVALGLLIPHRKKSEVAAGKHHEDGSMLLKMEHGLHPWVAFIILPLFAFANAGIHFAGMTIEKVTSPVPIGIACGLFFGKQIGVFLVSKAMIMLNLAKLPAGATWWQFYGVCMLCGIGFTMSLFIGGLSFDDPAMGDYVRMGVIMGSSISAICGSLLLYKVLPKAKVA